MAFDFGVGRARRESELLGEDIEDAGQTERGCVLRHRAGRKVRKIKLTFFRCGWHERFLRDGDERRAESLISVADCQIKLRFDVACSSREALEIEEIGIKQMRRDGVAERGQHGTADVWNLRLKLRDQTLDARAFQI